MAAKTLILLHDEARIAGAMDLANLARTERCILRYASLHLDLGDSHDDGRCGRSCFRRAVPGCALHRGLSLQVPTLGHKIPRVEALLSAHRHLLPGRNLLQHHQRHICSAVPLATNTSARPISPPRGCPTLDMEFHRESPGLIFIFLDCEL